MGGAELRQDDESGETKLRLNSLMSEPGNAGVGKKSGSRGL
jgi:hypothetical protein